MTLTRTFGMIKASSDTVRKTKRKNKSSSSASRKPFPHFLCRSVKISRKCFFSRMKRFKQPYGAVPRRAGDAHRLISLLFSCHHQQRQQGFAAVQPDAPEPFGVFFPEQNIFTSIKGEYKKPNPTIFQHALKSMDIKSGQSVMVGNSWRNDICGATQSGMDAVWIHPNHAKKNVPTQGWER